MPPPGVRQHDTSIITNAILDSAQKESLWGMPGRLPIGEGLEFGRTFNPSLPGGSGLIGLSTGFNFKESSRNVDLREAAEYHASFESLRDLSTFSRIQERAPSWKFKDDLVETFMHELAAHAGQHSLGEPDTHDDRPVRDIARDIDDFFHPPLRKQP